MSIPYKFLMLYTAKVFKQFTKNKLPLQSNVPGCYTHQVMSCTSSALAVKRLSVRMIAFCLSLLTATSERFCIQDTFIMSFLIVSTKEWFLHLAFLLVSKSKVAHNCMNHKSICSAGKDYTAETNRKWCTLLNPRMLKNSTKTYAAAVCYYSCMTYSSELTVELWRNCSNGTAYSHNAKHI